METLSIQDITPEMLMEGGFSIELVVRKHPKPAPVIKRRKDGTYTIIRECYQDELDSAVLRMAEIEQERNVKLKEQVQ